jgi:hypothetical protein
MLDTLRPNTLAWPVRANTVVPGQINHPAPTGKQVSNQQIDFGASPAFLEIEVREAVQMKNRVINLFGKAALPTLLAGAVLTLASPVAALAQGRGGHAGGFSGGGHAYSGGRSFGGGHAIVGGNTYRGGGYFRGEGYYRGGGLYLGFGSPYGYGPASPCGFYDRAGFWHPTPAACYSGVAVY